MTCKQCKHIDRCMSEASFLGQVFDPDYDGEHSCQEFDTFTNADRIRAMSDEELAEFIRDVSYECQDAYCGPHCQICSYPWCSSERTVEWLKQPAEVELQ